MMIFQRLSFRLKHSCNCFLEQTNYFFYKIEVVTDNAIVANSIRLLIIMLALLMAYNTPSKDKTEVSESSKIEKIEKSFSTGIEVTAITRGIITPVIR